MLDRRQIEARAQVLSRPLRIADCLTLDSLFSENGRIEGSWGSREPQGRRAEHNDADTGDQQQNKQRGSGSRQAAEKPPADGHCPGALHLVYADALLQQVHAA